MKKQIYILFTILLVLFPVTPTMVLADSELSFHVTPQFSEHQLEESENYFDLTLLPGEREELSLVLQNDSNKAIRVRVTPHTAYTNVNGIVDYGQDAKKTDDTLLYSLADLIDVPEVIHLEAYEQKTIHLSLQMPDKKIDGILAGGLRVEEFFTDEKTATEEKSLEIENNFSYIIGVIVRNNAASVTPKLNLLDVFPDQLNYRNVFSGTLQNSTPTFINQLSVSAQIRLKNTEKVLYKRESTGMQMAPNSQFNFPIPLEGQNFKNGTYTLSMSATSGENKWSWEQDFIINQSTAKKLNQSDVTVDTQLDWWIVPLIILGILVLVGLCILLYIKKKRK